MYVSRNDLGRFDIPEGENWPTRVTYFPEPPLAIRGALNPWEQERKRALYLLETKAWEQIKALQAEYKRKAAEFDYNAMRYNQLIPEIEKQTGGSGLQKVMNSKGFQAASMAITMTNPYGAAIAAALQVIKFAEMGISILSGEAKRKKKRIAELSKALEDCGKNMERLYGEMAQIAQNIVYLTQSRDRGMLQQSENVQTALNTNQIMQAQRKAETMTAAAAQIARATAARAIGGRQSYAYSDPL